MRAYSSPCHHRNGNNLLSLSARVLTLRLVLAVLLVVWIRRVSGSPVRTVQVRRPDAVRKGHDRNQHPWRNRTTRFPLPCKSRPSRHAWRRFQIGRVMSGGASGHNLQLIVDGSPFIQVRQPDPVRGWSVSPLFVRWNFPPTGRRGARIYGEIAGGVLFTSQPVPSPDDDL